MKTVQRRLLALGGLLFVAGGAYAAATAYERRHGADQAGKDKANRLVDCTSPIVGIRLERAGETIAIERRPEAPGASASTGPWGPWRLTSPLAASGDAATATALVDAVCELQALGRIEAKPGEPALAPAFFGLAPPKLTVAVAHADGQTQRLLIGDKSEFDGSLYVQQSNAPPAVDSAASDAHADPLFRVDGGFSFQVERDAFSLRDKRLLRLPGDAGTEAITEVRVVSRAAGTHPASRRGHGFSLRRSDDGAFVVQSDGDKALPADAGEARTLLDGLFTLRAKAFVDEAPQKATLARFSLAEPTFEVLLSVLQQPTPIAVRLGRLVLGEAPHLFAQVGEMTAPVAEVEAALLADKLARGEGALRDMRLLHLASDDVVHVRVWESEQNASRPPLHLLRTAADDQPDQRPHWQLAGDPNFPIDTSRVQGIVFRLAQLRADSLGVDAATPDALASAKLDAPAFRVAFADANDHPLATLRLGNEVGERRPAVGNDGPLGLVFANVADGLSADANDFASVATVR